MPAWRLATFVALACAASSTGAQPAPGTTLKGQAAFGDWRQDAPGVRRLITPQDLPAPSADSPNESKVIPAPAGALPRVPAGFEVELVASGLVQPRVIRTAPNGDLFVATSRAGEVRVLRVPPGSSRPTANEVFATGLRKPYGIAFHPPGGNPEWVYVANTDSLVRFPYRSGDLKASGPEQVLIERIIWPHHWTKDIAFSPDGKRLFLAVGSGSNVAMDMSPEPHEPGKLAAWVRSHPLGAPWDTEEKRAMVLSYDVLGKDEKIVATGLRNPAGIAIQPATGQLWAVINERDGLGDDTPFEYATRVEEGRFYGWPWYYIGAHEDARMPSRRPDLAGSVTVPDVLIQAHSAALQIVFYQGTSFPRDHVGDAFVALHGSWDRAKRTGYKVVRLIFDDAGKPTGEYEDFMTGFVASDAEVWGRPVGVAVGQDGSLFVTEDGNGTIWRVSHAP